MGKQRCAVLDWQIDSAITEGWMQRAAPAQDCLHQCFQQNAERMI